MASLDDNDDHDDVMMMVRKTSLKGCPIADICSNAERVIMTTFDGRVYTCDLADSWTQYNYVEVDAINIVSVCCSRHHLLALSADGKKIYSWGKNNEGQLGRPKKKRKNKKQNLSSQDLTPSLIMGLFDYDVIQIACGDDHSLALTRDGRLFSWGSNTHSQLGVDTQGKRAKHHVDKPTEIEALLGVPLQHIAAGGAHSVVLSTSGSVFVWGRNSHRQLGLQQKKDVKRPVKLGYMSQERVKDISCGMNHTSFLKENGELLVYGIGAGRFPCDFEQWNESELQPWQPNRFQTFSSIRSTSRCTYLVDEINDDLYVLSHDKVEQDGPSRNLQIKPLDVRSFVDLLEPDSLTNWPPGNYAFDTSVWEQSSLNEGAVATYRERCRDNVAEIEQSLEPASKGRPSSSEGRGKFLNESLSNTPSPGSDRTQTRSSSMSSETVIQHSKTQLANGVSLHYSDPAANPTAATISRSNATPDTVDTAQMRVRVNDGSALHDENLVGLEDNMTNLVAAVGSLSVTEEGGCPEEVLVEHGRDTVDGQESISRRTPRRWRRICAGQGRIFIVEHEELESEEVHISFAPRRKIDTLSAELIQSLKDAEFDITKKSTLFQQAKKIFSSPACLNASFQQRGPNEVGGLNVDLNEARLAFEIINNNTKLLEMISKVVSESLCNNAPRSTTHEEALRFYLILMEFPIFTNPDNAWGRKVLAAVGRLKSFLGNASSTGNPNPNLASTLARWWKFEPMSFRRMVTAYRVALIFLINNRTILEKEVDKFWIYLRVLSSLNEVNIQHDIVSLKTFYISGINKVDIWQMYGEKNPLSKFSWRSYPFLIDLEMKIQMLEEQNWAQQLRAMAGEVRTRLNYDFWGRPCIQFLPPMPLHITVRRDDIFGTNVREQLVEMLRYTRSTLQKPLMITFEGEMGIDAGALSLDFFRLVFEKLLDPKKKKKKKKKKNLFRYIDEGDPTLSSVWFGKDCKDTQTAEICGLLLGLSIYNKALVPLPFPQLLYAKLLGKGPKTEMEEVAELDKDFADQMSKLKTGTEEYVIGSCYGEELELEDGRSAEITTENVHLYVEKMIREHLVPGQFAAFQKGFNKVYNPEIMSMFRPIELEALVMGEKYLDWIALEQSAKYTMPYSASHSTIKMFWKAFHELDDDMKRKFLVFVSGSDRVPVGGLRCLGLTIAELPVPSDDSVVDGDRLALLLPVGHACDNYGMVRTLKLPMYTSPALIKDRLTVALTYYDCPFHIA